MATLFLICLPKVCAIQVGVKWVWWCAKVYAEVACTCVCSVVSDSLQLCALQPTRLLCPWDFPRILEWVAVSSSRGSNAPASPALAGRFFCHCSTWEAHAKVGIPSYANILETKHLILKCLDVCTGGFPGGASGKEPTCQCERLKRCGFDPWVRNSLEEGMATHSSILA